MTILCGKSASARRTPDKPTGSATNGMQIAPGARFICSELLSFATLRRPRMLRSKLVARPLALVFSMLAALAPALAQAPATAKSDAPPKRLAIRAGHLIDGKSD